MTALRFIFTLILALVLATPFISRADDTGKPDILGNIVIILDASGSMWGHVEGQSKISIAKDTLTELIEKLPDTVAAGLVAYGHRKKGDCGDVEELVPLAPMDRARLKKAVKALSPKGKTPITESIRRTAEGLRSVEQETTIMLVSDGKETCDDDPCALVKELKDSGLKLVVDVIGFDVTDEERQQLECIAENSGGTYYSAKNADQFRKAVVQTSKKESLSAGKLHVVTTRNGKEIPAKVEILSKGSGEVVFFHWTVKGLGLTRNLKPGDYVLKITDDKAANEPVQEVPITIESGATLEQTVDFSSGVINMPTTIDGTPFECFITVFRTGHDDPGNRMLQTFSDNSKHVAKLVLPAGEYDIHVKHRKTADAPTRIIKAVGVASGEERELPVTFESGGLEVIATRDGQEIKAEAKVLNNETRSTIWFEKCQPGKPAVFKLTPGVYTVKVNGTDENDQRFSALVKDVTITAQQTNKLSVEVSAE